MCLWQKRETRNGDKLQSDLNGLFGVGREYHVFTGQNPCLVERAYLDGRHREWNVCVALATVLGRFP
jgi:hypothetical protein